MHKKTVSVVIPVYNAERRLKKCLDSLLGQSFDDLEIILVDDGSTDTSNAICREYASRDSRFVLIEKTNSGVSAARNDGLRAAKGKYVAFVDSDDTVGEQYILDLVNSIERIDDIANGIAIHGCVIDYYKHGNLRKSTRITLPQSKYTPVAFLSQIDGQIPLVTAQTVWGKLYYHSIIKDNSIFFDEDVSLSEDFLFNLQYLSYASHVITDVHSDYHYYKSEAESAVHRYHPEYLDTVEHVFFLLQQLMKNDFTSSFQYMFREYCRAIYHYYSNYSRSTKEERLGVIMAIYSSPFFLPALNTKRQRGYYRLIQMVLKYGSVKVADFFFTVTSLLRRY